MKSKRLSDKILYFVICACAAVTVGILLWIIGFIVINGIGSISWEFLTAPYSTEGGGIMPMIISTFYMVLLTIVIATPIGIFTAIYLNEYAHEGKIVAVIRFAIDSLSGIPSIIYGLFGMIFFVTALKFDYSILSGSITLSIMILPTIIRTSEESLKSVPVSFKEGSLGLGASKLRTIFKIALPSAMTGIVTAVILSIGRIVGETAAVYLTAGMTPQVPENIMSSGRTLSVHLYMLAKEAVTPDAFSKAYATGTVLIITVFIINTLANFLAKKLKKEY